MDHRQMGNEADTLGIFVVGVEGDGSLRLPSPSTPTTRQVLKIFKL